MAIPDRVKTSMEKVGLSKVNTPKRTPNHPEKTHVVMASEGGDYKLIRFGDKNADPAGKPKEGESRADKLKRKSFYARHRDNIARGKMSGSWWSARERW